VRMPTVNLELLDGDALEYARRITKKDGTLRASKPPMRYTLVPHPWGGMMRQYDLQDASAAYIWRYVAFYVSPNPKHQCIPTLADLDLPFDEPSEADAYIKNVLNPIIDAIVDAVPVSQWHGVRRWGQAFGVVGTPRYNDEGAVIYR